MGGFPSHDAAAFLYTTAVQHPAAMTGGGTTEICLVPLLRRYFNDNNKKLKDAVTQIYFQGPPNCTQIALEALQQGIPSAPSSPPSTPLAAGASLSSSAEAGGIAALHSTAEREDARRQHAVTAYREMERLLGQIESSLFTNTRVVFEAGAAAAAKAEAIHTARAKKRREENAFLFDASTLDTANETSAEEAHSAEGSCMNAKAMNELLRGNSSTAQAQWPMLRPVPCAICVIEPESGGRKSSSGSGASAGQTHTINGITITDWATVQNRKLHCIGYLSCFSSQLLARQHSKHSHQKPAHMAATPTNSDHRRGTASGAGACPTGSGYSKPTIPRLMRCGDDGLDVYFEIVLEHESFNYMIEPIVFLASMTFRSQFLTCSMWQRPSTSKEVEEVYYNHLRLLNVHVLLPKDSYHQLRAFHEQYPLVELLDELGLNDKCIARPASTSTAPGAVPSVKDETVEIPSHSAAEAGAGAEGAQKDFQNSVTIANGMDNVDGNGSDTAKCTEGHDGEEEEEDGDVNGAATAKDGEKIKKAEEQPAAESMGDHSSTKNDTKRSRNHNRNRKRLKKIRMMSEQDEIYRRTSCRMPRFSFYELHAGESGMEMVIEGDVLARFMKFVTEAAAFETVKSNYIRCDLGPLMKERRHMMQTLRDTQQDFMDEEDEDERLLGSELLATALQTWLREGSLAEERKKQALAASQATQKNVAAMYQAQPANIATAATVGGPQIVYLPGVGFVATQPANMGSPVPAATAGAAAPMIIIQHQQPQPQPQPHQQQQPQQHLLQPLGAIPGATMQAAVPQYFFNPATQQVQVMMTAVPQMQQQQNYLSMLAFQQQAQAQMMSQYYMAAAAAAVPQQQVQYQYVQGPNNQIMMVPLTTAAPQLPQALPHTYVPMTKSTPQQQQQHYAQMSSVAVGNTGVAAQSPSGQLPQRSPADSHSTTPRSGSMPYIHSGAGAAPDAESQQQRSAAAVEKPHVDVKDPALGDGEQTATSHFRYDDDDDDTNAALAAATAAMAAMARAVVHEDSEDDDDNDDGAPNYFNSDAFFFQRN